jgi:SAM-dependent methyltransferase
MQEYDSSTYGDRIAHLYDGLRQFTPEETQVEAEALAQLAQGRCVLELGIGTGRVALPLREKGLEVCGIDASSKMIEELRKKPGGESIPVVMGDFSHVPVEGKFGLIFVTFNTFFALTTQEAQVRCFASVAAHLLPGGLFVIEAFVPDLSRFTRNQSVVVSRIGLDEVRFDVSQHDPVHQRVTAQHVVITQGQTQLFPVQIRYAWPSELDLMAQLAGLRLKERWSNWEGAPFTSGSGAHVSMYERA